MLAIEARDDLGTARRGFWMASSLDPLNAICRVANWSKLFYRHRITHTPVSVYLFRSRAEWAKKGRWFHRFKFIPSFQHTLDPVDGYADSPKVYSTSSRIVFRQENNVEGNVQIRRPCMTKSLSRG